MVCGPIYYVMSCDLIIVPWQHTNGYSLFDIFKWHPSGEVIMRPFTTISEPYRCNHYILHHPVLTSCRSPCDKICWFGVPTVWLPEIYPERKLMSCFYSSQHRPRDEAVGNLRWQIEATDNRNFCPCCEAATIITQTTIIRQGSWGRHLKDSSFIWRTECELSTSERDVNLVMDTVCFETGLFRWIVLVLSGQSWCNTYLVNYSL